jgi:uncharacterized membrane protein YhdT
MQAIKALVAHFLAVHFVVSSFRQKLADFVLISFGFFAILGGNARGGIKMPFWTKFWVIAPPIVLLVITLIYYIASGKKREG